MAKTSLRAVLEKSLAQSQEDQRSSIEFLENARQSDTANFLSNLSEILSDTQENAFIRQAAGLQLKNVLTAKDSDLKAKCIQRWLELPTDVRQKIKVHALGTLGSETARPSIAAQCVAAIAFAEIPVTGWPECIPHLTCSITQGSSSEALQAACLESLGYICQDTNPKYLTNQCNAILTAIVHGMRENSTSNYVRLVATEALYNSLEFTKENFENEHERNVIMQVVCEATQCADLQVKVMALQCSVRIMSLYYDHMEVYMKAALFAITLEAMKSDNDEVVLQGIEFWSNVCDEELLLSLEMADAAEKNETPAHVSRGYASAALEYILPVLVEIMTRQEENDDDEEWLPCKAAGVCLMLLAQCVGDQMVAKALPFVAENVHNADWHRREAALMVFGSLLDGPGPANLALLVNEGLAVVLNGLRDNHAMVRDAAAWALGRICEFCGEIVSQRQYIETLLPVVYESLSQDPKVVSSICWAIGSLASAIRDAAVANSEHNSVPETCAISACYETLLTQLLKVGDRPDASLSNLRIAAYEALMELIKSAPSDCYQLVHNLMFNILNRMEQLIQAVASGAGDIHHINDVQALMCATLQSLLRRLERVDVLNSGDTIMTMLLQIIVGSLNRNSTVAEEAFMACSAFVEMIEKDFTKYFEALKPYLNFALMSMNDTQLCMCAIGLLDDLSRALEKELVPMLGEYMTILMSILSNPSCDKTLKCMAISVIGDLAIASDQNFVPYVSPVLTAIVTALSTEVDEGDYDDVDFANSLRQNCLEAFTSILQSMRTYDSQGKTYVISAEVRSILEESAAQIVQRVGKILSCGYSSEEATLAAIGVIGDICLIFENRTASLIHKPFLALLVHKGMELKSQKGKSVLEWTIKKLSVHVDVSLADPL